MGLRPYNEKNSKVLRNTLIGTGAGLVGAGAVAAPFLWKRHVTNMLRRKGFRYLTEDQINKLNAATGRLWDEHMAEGKTHNWETDHDPVTMQRRGMLKALQGQEEENTPEFQRWRGRENEMSTAMNIKTGNTPISPGLYMTPKTMVDVTNKAVDDYYNPKGAIIRNPEYSGPADFGHSFTPNMTDIYERTFAQKGWGDRMDDYRNRGSIGMQNLSNNLGWRQAWKMWRDPFVKALKYRDEDDLNSVDPANQRDGRGDGTWFDNNLMSLISGVPNEAPADAYGGMVPRYRMVPRYNYGTNIWKDRVRQVLYGY